MKQLRVKIRLAVKREVDGAMDAFEVTLPVKDDREKRRLETFVQVKREETISFPSLEEESQTGNRSPIGAINLSTRIGENAVGSRLLGALPISLHGAAHQPIDARTSPQRPTQSDRSRRPC